MEDERFATPMIICNAGHVFIYDFVQCHTSNGLVSAKVTLFFKKVKFEAVVLAPFHHPSIGVM